MVNLKLANIDGSDPTTMLLHVDDDSFFVPQAGGNWAVAIGSDIYQVLGEELQIYGMQIMTSSEDLTGQVYSLSSSEFVGLTDDNASYSNASDKDIIEIVKISAVSKSAVNLDADLSFSGSVVDADGDSHDFSFDVHVEADGIDAPTATLPPVVIDLDRDGSVDYLSLSEGISPQSIGVPGDVMAWTAASDGLLAYDYNQDGEIMEAQEFVFTMWGTDPDVATDMQALAAYFDSNHDGIFAANDQAWEYFGVWQDLNTDGVQQEGEFNYLDYWGIDSIALEYDEGSSAYITADGDVQVYGQMTVSYDDGSTGLAEDVAFAVSQMIDDTESIDADSVPVESAVGADQADGSSIDLLVAEYLEAMQDGGDLDGDGNVDVAELAYGLDEAVSNFLEVNSLSAEDYDVIQQEVFNQLADQLNALDSDEPAEIGVDQFGDAVAASVLAALDDNFDDLLNTVLPEQDDYSADSALSV